MRHFTLARVFMGMLGCCGLLSITAQAQVVVRMETSLGDIDVELYDVTAPITTENFLNYVNSNRYDNTFIHRSMPGLVIQGGSYVPNGNIIDPITTDAPIANEYDPSRSNIRGSIAMAKIDGNPNSATSGWFFNLADNTAILNDTNNGGFAVFGQVIGDGMDVVDAIAALFIQDCSPGVGSFDDLPLIDYVICPNTYDLFQQHLVNINNVRVILNVQGNLAAVEDHNGNIVALTAVAPATLSNVVASAAPNSNTPNGVTFLEGFFSFQIDGLTPGASTSVAMQLPSGYEPNTYYMYGPTPDNHNAHWYEFKFDGQTGAEFFGNNFVVLNFVDGARGDADLTANGQISDPGAPGVTAAAAPSSSPGGGGCTLAANPRAPSIPADFGLLALIFLAYKIKRPQARSSKATIGH